MPNDNSSHVFDMALKFVHVFFFPPWFQFRAQDSVASYNLSMHSCTAAINGALHAVASRKRSDSTINFMTFSQQIQALKPFSSG